ncbi:gamma-glutamyl-gamma-aminobutyrate hydrolase family protein [Clostridium beijerinckii]|jgi:Predicted glutamine amidotransferases|uniref:Gamma-glutamyl-gamma-aminobutyrate hydrolase family protein n=2 Tax=Clostridium beijerinckii TaxID=1520 RepID=A0AAE2RN65_CLOBE|nr:gamma-glutamyl-gamma-aminobutyrate hydrolase family protein [Clostridium beijerinckii]ABR33043.1 peptidase C26 [Clostridium beijerinckii NCIMB 8052]AIU02351.1 peptidase C26 [Clostridium beijerinckii ATCC 35702]MBF7807276.1 gamma-glutamyl-gamma-aminobutyrate hydrolase family protein [Clostridium beijerinckii]NRT25711.1 putative glutamine amidotransferase [Clostridium beijerinckii]NRT66694.1 putative glutamine amidotransferase [Clostridium beijerinckii]
MNKPIIGINSNRVIKHETQYSHSVVESLGNDYVESVIKAGGVPIILPILSDEESIRRQVELLDGIVLSGGIDINPLLYNEEPSPKLGYIYPDKDEFDLTLVKIAYELNKPILAICRGHQILNVAFGGTLYQDLSDMSGCYIKHHQQTKDGAASHTLEIIEGSILYEILGNTALINSFHHQAIKDLAPGFKVTAYSKDKVIEAIESCEKNFVIGVQFHPEIMTAYNDKNMLKLFEAFINASYKNNSLDHKK